jgi:hypothetical protein
MEILLRDGDEGGLPSVQGIRTQRSVTESSGDSQSASQSRINSRAGVNAVKDDGRKKKDEPTIASQSNRNDDLISAKPLEKHKSSQDADKSKQNMSFDKIDKGHQNPNKEPELQDNVDKEKRSKESHSNDLLNVNTRNREDTNEQKTKESAAKKSERHSESGEKNKSGEAIRPKANISRPDDVREERDKPRGSHTEKYDKDESPSRRKRSRDESKSPERRREKKVTSNARRGDVGTVVAASRHQAGSPPSRVPHGSRPVGSCHSIILPELVPDGEAVASRRSASSQRSPSRKSTIPPPLFSASSHSPPQHRGRSNFLRGRGWRPRGQDYRNDRNAWSQNVRGPNRQRNHDEAMINTQFTQEQYRKILHLLSEDNKKAK